jgi:hypothetical protein
MTSRINHLSRACRHSLKAIQREFYRCSLMYPPLYHEKLAPWTESGFASISIEEWQAFQAAMETDGEVEEWWTWDGPHVGPEYDDPPFLGRWTGSFEGIDEFVLLSETVCEALADADLGDLRTPRGYGGWLWFLHHLAFHHQILLLQSDMNVWGCEEYPDCDEFFEKIEEWHEPGGKDLRYPKHPLIWRLIHNVFTSSMTAVDALLCPERVIATNEPLNLGVQRDRTVVADKPQVQIEAFEHAASSPATSSGGNAFKSSGLIWSITFVYKDVEEKSCFQQSVGFDRWARLLSAPYKHFKPSDFSPSKNNDNPSTAENAGDGDDDDSERKSEALQQRADWSNECRMDEPYRRELRAEIETYTARLKEAEAAGKKEAVQKFTAQLHMIKAVLRKDSDNNGKSRPLGTSNYERGRKRVANSLERTRRKIAEKMPVLGQHLKDHLNSTSGFVYEPPGDFEDWIVETGKS